MVKYPDDVLVKIEVPEMDRNGYAACFCYSLSCGWLFYDLEDGWRKTVPFRILAKALETKYAREKSNVSPE